MNKTYADWRPVKAKINNEIAPPQYFHAGEIWRCIIGENIGREQDGKEDFLRPVVIFKKSGRTFTGIPLTSQAKDYKPYFYHLGEFYGKDSVAMLSQVTTWDAARLKECLGKLSKEQFARLSEALARWLFEKSLTTLLNSEGGPTSSSNDIR